jgi:hypothetical protein
MLRKLKIKERRQETMEEKNYFELLNSINVNDKTEKKNGLTYLSWAWAWGEVKKKFPDATYKIYETTNPQGYVCNYYTDGRTCWVKTGVIIQGIEHIEELPVMDYKNKSIPLENVNSFDVNKAIQRSLTKAVARHGLGLYIYAGEDLPEEERNDNKIDQMDEKQLEKIELENKCKMLGIDLKSSKTQTWIATKLEESSGKKELDEKFNLGQYNQILGFMIRSKEKENG